jgi:tRNA-specific 2-thiouridylase
VNFACKEKVAVAMSGGVDSSVAAGLLLNAGYDVVGVSLRLWDCQRQAPQNCSDYMGARMVAKTLGIPHFMLDFRSEFVDRVVKPFARSYLAGRTPNPCVACNRDFKLGVLLNWAEDQGMAYVATGHYARVIRHPSTGECSLLRGRDRQKDQSYFLFALSQEQLAHSLFPLGDFDKTQVRDKARAFGLHVADRPESQDICLGDHKSLVESLAEEGDLCEGEIVDRSGRVLGAHRGIHRLTIGQRKGLGISSPYPLYVLEIDQKSKRVVVGKKEELGCQGLVVQTVNWIEHPQESNVQAEVQVRYRSAPVFCVAKPGKDGELEVHFRDDFSPVTPGQAAVFYRGERVLGGGWIERGIT